MKNIFKQTNLPFLLLISIVLKAIIFANPIFDGIAIVAVSGLFGFKLWLDHNKKPDHNKILDEKFQQEINDVNARIRHMDEKISTLGSNFALSQKSQNSSKVNYGWGR